MLTTELAADIIAELSVVEYVDPLDDCDTLELPVTDCWQTYTDRLPAALEYVDTFFEFE